MKIDCKEYMNTYLYVCLEYVYIFSLKGCCYRNENQFKTCTYNIYVVYIVYIYCIKCFICTRYFIGLSPKWIDKKLQWKIILHYIPTKSNTYIRTYWKVYLRKGIMVFWFKNIRLYNRTYYKKSCCRERIESTIKKGENRLRCLD